MLISTSLSSLICSWLASRCSQRSPSQQRFPWALQLKDQILKEQITDDHVFFKMPFRPCPSGCGHCLSADDGHDRCLQCLGFQHAEDAFVDDSCACCGRMSMTSLRSRHSFLKGLAPSAATRAGLSGSSRGSPAGERPVRFPDDFAGSSHGAPAFHSVRHPWIECRLQHRGMGLRPLRMKVRRGCPPRVLLPPPHRTQS